MKIDRMTVTGEGAVGLHIGADGSVTMGSKGVEISEAEASGPPMSPALRVLAEKATLLMAGRLKRGMAVLQVNDREILAWKDEEGRWNRYTSCGARLRSLDARIVPPQFVLDLRHWPTLGAIEEAVCERGPRAVQVVCRKDHGPPGRGMSAGPHYPVWFWVVMDQHMEGVKVGRGTVPDGVPPRAWALVNALEAVLGAGDAS